MVPGAHICHSPSLQWEESYGTKLVLDAIEANPAAFKGFLHVTLGNEGGALLGG